MDEFDELCKIHLAKGIVVLASKVKGLRDTRPRQGRHEGSLGFLGGQRRVDREVIGHYEVVIMPRKMGEGKRVEDFVGESWDNGRLGEVLDRSLYHH